RREPLVGRSGDVRPRNAGVADQQWGHEILLQRTGPEDRSVPRWTATYRWRANAPSTLTGSTETERTLAGTPSLRDFAVNVLPSFSDAVPAMGRVWDRLRRETQIHCGAHVPTRPDHEMRPAPCPCTAHPSTTPLP